MANVKQNNIETERLSYWAQCLTCKWEGPSHNEQSSAQQDADQHAASYIDHYVVIVSFPHLTSSRKETAVMNKSKFIELHNQLEVSDLDDIFGKGRNWEDFYEHDPTGQHCYVSAWYRDEGIAVLDMEDWQYAGSAKVKWDAQNAKIGYSDIPGELQGRELALFPTDMHGLVTCSDPAWFWQRILPLLGKWLGKIFRDIADLFDPKQKTSVEECEDGKGRVPEERLAKVPWDNFDPGKGHVPTIIEKKPNEKDQFWGFGEQYKYELNGSTPQVYIPLRQGATRLVYAFLDNKHEDNDGHPAVKLHLFYR